MICQSARDALLKQKKNILWVDVVVLHHNLFFTNFRIIFSELQGFIHKKGDFPVFVQ